MRKWLVLACAVAPLAILAYRLWPAPDDAAEPGSYRYIPTGELALTEQTCTAPILADLRARPHWSLRVDERHWSDAVDDEPDELSASVEIDATTAHWRDGAFAEGLALDVAERAQILDALELSCIDAKEQAALGGRTYELAYGATGVATVRINGFSPAGQQLGDAMAAIRARYVAIRRGEARRAVIALHGQQRISDPRTWERMTLTSKDGALEIEPIGGQLLDDQAQVELLDWAQALPDHLDGSSRQVFTGTLTLEGVSRPIAVSLAQLGDRTTHKHLQSNVALFRLTWILAQNNPS